MSNNEIFSKQEELTSLEGMLAQAVYKHEREAIFAEVANLRFEKNLKAFKSYFPEIYEKYLTYQPSEKFELIVNENGTANIIDYDSGLPIYSDDPKGQAAEQVKKNIDAPILGMTDHSKVALLENDSGFTHIDLMRSVGQIYNETKSNLSIFKKLGKSIPSIMVFGIGLGYHLDGILTACKAGYVNFFEPNEDYFFASLFVIDWNALLTKIDENGSFLYLGIGLKEEEIYEQFYSRSRAVSVASISHAWFYQHYPSVNVNKWISEFRNNYHQFFAGFGFFDDAVMGLAHSVGNFDNNLPYLYNKTLDDALLEDIPVFIVANGPSLDKEMEFIKNNQDKAIVFACNSASTALVRHGIMPDFHVALERTESTYHFLKEHVPEESRKKINLLITNVMNPKVASLFGWAGGSLKPGEAGSQVIQLAQYRKDQRVINTLSFCNPLVGNTALSYACHLGFKQIYLFGVDNGYVDKEHHHSKSSFYYDDKGKTKVQPFKVGHDFVVPGNFRETVLTDQFMHVGNVQMGRLLQSFQGKGITVFNCSDGSRIEHTIPLHSTDIILNERVIDKPSLVDYVKNNKFSNFDLKDEVEKLLCIDEFEQFCRVIVDILEQPITDRTEALETLLESLRYIYSFRNSAQHLGLYFLIEGEALYMTTILLSLLYNFGNDDEIVPYFSKALEEWCRYLSVAPEFYRNNVRIYK
ncbi:6-hydroxymethylpterin diphosphokinase MptE-like protein [Pseudoalteromonas fenneropenaei]|uniref:6-hydroxymethylpterin diphosphokinase MptE-like protein n=1 Tax=Pseudoalteromonas fenneropenaei TaxID=1737459 RepID=A0ABV7CH44_9GAMM